MKTRRFIRLWIAFCLILGAIIGGALTYASQHPESPIHQKFTSWGFHLDKK
ncbi:MAG: hypothetical protein WC603_02625 [Candidatus Paceibacterota bacterium]